MTLSPRPVASAVRPVGYLGLGLAIGIAITVVAFLALGGRFGGTSSSSIPSPVTVCPSSTEASTGNASPSGPSVEAGGISVHSHAWAVGATATVVTKPIPVAAGSTLLVFVGFVGSSVGGPVNATVCDSTGDLLFLQASTSAFSSNHSELLFLGFDVVGGGAVSFAATFNDTASEAGGTIAVIDLASPSPLDLGNLIAGSNVGDSSTATVAMHALGPSFVVFGVAGQGDDGPFGALGTESLLDTNGYYDAGPWTDGESFGTMVSATSGGSVVPSASLTEAGVWDAIGAVVS